MFNPAAGEPAAQPEITIDLRMKVNEDLAVEISDQAMKEISAITDDNHLSRSVCLAIKNQWPR